MKGIDISSYQGTVPWHTMHDVSFGIVKVTEGEGYTNPYWKDNAINLRVTNKIRGFYMFSLPGQGSNTAEAEAAYFWSKIENIISKGDLIACDVEKTNLSPKLTSDWTLSLLQHLEYLAGYKPFLYTYPSFIDQYLKSPKLANYPLWLAWYKSNLPRSYAQWRTIALWQMGPGKIQGVSGQVDIDIFLLGAHELERYGKP
jgi:lysozyme